MYKVNFKEVKRFKFKNFLVIIHKINCKHKFKYDYILVPYDGWYVNKRRRNIRNNLYGIAFWRLRNIYNKFYKLEKNTYIILGRTSYVTIDQCTEAAKENINSALVPDFITNINYSQFVKEMSHASNQTVFV